MKKRIIFNWKLSWKFICLCQSINFSDSYVPCLSSVFISFLIQKYGRMSACWIKLGLIHKHMRVFTVQTHKYWSMITNVSRLPTRLSPSSVATPFSPTVHLGFGRVPITLLFNGFVSLESLLKFSAFQKLVLMYKFILYFPLSAIYMLTFTTTTPNLFYILWWMSQD